MSVGVVFSAQLGRTTPYSILPLLVEVFPNYNEGLAPPMSLCVCVLSWVGNCWSRSHDTTLSRWSQTVGVSLLHNGNRLRGWWVHARELPTLLVGFVISDDWFKKVGRKEPRRDVRPP